MHPKKSLLIILISLLIAAGLDLKGTAVQASTTLIPADLNTPGDQLLTIDTATGLAWLDLTITDGLSFNQVSAQLGPGGTLEGFRYATLAEVVELWENAGIDTTGLPSPTPTIANFAPIIAFQALVGLTDIGPNTSDSMGLVADTDMFGDHPAPFARIFTAGPFTGTGIVVSSATRSPDQIGPNFGSWLIKSTSSATLKVEIDIKPGSDPNSINCKNEKGVIPVAILTTEDFDATTVDHTTVTFEGASETHVNKKSGEPKRHEEDVDGDGDTDLVFHFRLGDTDLTCDSTEGTLTAETFDGVVIEGTDTIRMVK